MILEIAAGALGLLIYVIIIKPIIPLIKLKIQYGNQAKLSFFPIFGDQMYNKQSLDKYNDEIEYRKQLIKKNKNLKFILTNYFSNVFIIILDPNYYKHVYINHQQFFKNNFIGHNLLLDQGLIFLVGETWQQLRNMLGPSFNYDKLKESFPMMNQVIVQAFQYMEESNLHKLTAKITGQIALQFFFGELADDPRLSGITEQVTKILVEAVKLRNKNFLVSLKISILKQRSWSIPFLNREKDLLENIQKIRQCLQKMVNERIENWEIKQKCQNQQGFLDVMISHYLEDKTKVTIEMMIQQFITLVFAGTHTTSTAAVFCIYFLSEYPDIQDELLLEIHQICGTENMSSVHLPKLVKLDAFIKETLRLKNPTPRIISRSVKQDTTILDLNLKKDWVVSPSFEVSVTNEKYIDNPYEFNYKRWINGCVFKEDNGFLYVPFSAGGRNCIGQHMAIMEIKLILIQILKQFKVVSNKKDLQFPIHFTYTILPSDFAKLVKRD